MSFRVLLMSLMATTSLAIPHHKFLRKDDVLGDSSASSNEAEPFPPSVGAPSSLDGVSGSFKREISSQEDAGMADLGSGTILNNNTALMNHGMSPMQSNPETVGLEIDEGSAETPSSLSVDPVNNTASSSSLTAASDAPIKPPGNVESLSNGRHLRSILKEADKREVTTIKAPSCHCRSGRSYGETNQLMDLDTTTRASAGTVKQYRPVRSVPESNSAVTSVSKHQDPVTEQVSASPDPSIRLQGTGSMEDLTPLSDVSTGPTMQRTARCACAKIKRETNLDESSSTATNITISGNSLGSLNATSGGNAHLSPASGNDANVSAEIPLLSSDQVPASDSEVKLSNRTPQNAGRRQNNEHVQTRYARVVGSDGKPLDATSAASSAANKTDESKSPIAKTENATGVAQNASQVASSSKEISKNNATTFVTVSSTNASTTNTTATTNEAANETDESRSPVAKTANATIAHVNSTETAQNATRVAARMKEISTINATIVPVSSTNISTTTATTNEAADKADESIRSSVLITANATVAHVNSTGVAQNALQVASSSKEISKNNATTFVTVSSTNASTTNTTATTNEADAYTEKYEDHYGLPIAPYRKFYPVTKVIMVTRKPTSSRGSADLGGKGVSIKQMAAEYSSSHHLSASTFLAVGALLLSQFPFLPAYIST